MKAKSPKSSEVRNVLVAVSGQTPVIITETLWALVQKRKVRIDEIRVITTAEGRRSFLPRLLGEDGRLSAYCSDYNVPPGRILFSEKSVYTLEGPDGASGCGRSGLRAAGALDDLESKTPRFIARTSKGIGLPRRHFH